MQTRVGRIPPDPPLPDFSIGARAAVCMCRLPTRDVAGGRACLPPWQLRAPIQLPTPTPWRYSMCSALVRSNSSLPHRDPPRGQHPDGSAYAPRQPADWSPAAANWARSTFAPAGSVNLRHRRAVRIRHAVCDIRRRKRLVGRPPSGRRTTEACGRLLRSPSDAPRGHHSATRFGAGSRPAQRHC